MYQNISFLVNNISVDNGKLKCTRTFLLKLKKFKIKKFQNIISFLKNFSPKTIHFVLKLDIFFRKLKEERWEDKDHWEIIVSFVF